MSSITTETLRIGEWRRSPHSRESGLPPHAEPFAIPSEPARLWTVSEDGRLKEVQDWDGCRAPVLEQPARARLTDPATSHAAALSVKTNPGRAIVLDALRRFGPMTDEEIHPQVSLVCSPSGARTRRAELVDMGLVCDSGIRRKTVAGRRTIVWMAVPESHG